MKKILLLLVAIIVLISTAACQSGDTDNQQKAEMQEYLRSVNVTLNYLPQASQFTTPPKDLSIVDQPQTDAIFTDIIAKYQNGLQNIEAETVPAIDDAQTLHDTSMNLVKDSLKALQDMQTTLNAGNQGNWAEAVDNYTALLPRVTGFYRLIESMADKYGIADTEIDYRYRG